MALALVAATVSASALGASSGFPGRNGAIVFNSERRGNVDLYLRRAGGKVVRLTRSLGVDEYASFSADGKLIAFARQPRVGGPDVYVIHPASVPLPPPAVPAQPNW